MKIDKIVLLGCLISDISVVKAFDKIEFIDLKEAIVKKETQDIILNQLLKQKLIYSSGTKRDYFLDEARLQERLLDNGLDKKETLEVSEGIEGALEILRKKENKLSLTETLDSMGLLDDFDREAGTGTICV